MKKILLILLCVFSFAIIHAEITWTLSDDGTLTISGTDMPSYSAINQAPWYPQREKIMKVVIESGVTNIGKYSFYGCYNLTSVTIPNSVTTIGRSAFCDCRSLSSITIPNSVTTIVQDFLSGCYILESNLVNNSNCDIGLRNLTFIDTEQEDGLLIKNNEVVCCRTWATSISIPKSVTSIGKSAFLYCSGLISITIPESVTSIGESAFVNCSSLTSITIPESVTNIGGSAFNGAKLRNIVIKAKTPPSGSSAFSDQTYYHTTLLIPDGCWDAYAYSDDIWYKFINIREMAYNAVNLTNSKAYTMKLATEGSYLFYDSVNDCVGTLNETAFDDTEENNTWMTVEVDGKNYVYNLGAKKFLVPDKANTSKTGYSLSNTPVSIDIKDGKDAIVFGKGKEFYMVINEKLNVDEGLESQIISTGINEIDVESNQPTVTYNLNGQRINKSNAQKGVYIKNGKKYAK